MNPTRIASSAISAVEPAVFSFFPTPYEKPVYLRIITRNKEPWFVADDVAQILGYRDAEKMTRMLDDDEKGTHNVGTLGGNQEMLIINESGLYNAIFKSRRPEAVKFRKWVTSEVLPKIRKTGKYELPSSVTQNIYQYLDESKSSALTLSDLLLRFTFIEGSNHPGSVFDHQEQRRINYSSLLQIAGARLAKEWKCHPDRRVIKLNELTASSRQHELSRLIGSGRMSEIKEASFNQAFLIEGGSCKGYKPLQDGHHSLTIEKGCISGHHYSTSDVMATLKDGEQYVMVHKGRIISGIKDPEKLDPDEMLSSAFFDMTQQRLMDGCYKIQVQNGWIIKHAVCAVPQENDRRFLVLQDSVKSSYQKLSEAIFEMTGCHLDDGRFLITLEQNKVTEFVNIGDDLMISPEHYHSMTHDISAMMNAFFAGSVGRYSDIDLQEPKFPAIPSGVKSLDPNDC